MNTVRDRLWAWAHAAGSHNDQYNLPARSRMTPVEGAFYLGVPNLIMVVYGGNPPPPFHPHAVAMRPLRRLIWSIVGDSSSKRDDVDAVRALASEFPNVTGAIMDDFFQAPDDQGRIARRSVEELGAFRPHLRAAARPLELWCVVYSHQLDLPMQAHLACCDVATFWTWRAKDLPALDESFRRFERLAPDTRKVLGCYMWNYGEGAPMPLNLMQMQCELGAKWLRDGRIEGMIFLATCICDLELETVEWTREWIARHADEAL